VIPMISIVRRSAALGICGLVLALTSSACGSSTDPTPPTGHTVTTALALSGRPHGVASIGDNFCVSQIDANGIACGTVTANGATVGATIPVGSTPAHVALSPDGRTAYTANQSGNTMSVVDLQAGHTVATVPLLDGGYNLLVDPSGTRIYVTTAGGTLNVIDASSRQVIAKVPVGAGANGLALNQYRGLLYVSSISTNRITEVSTAVNSVIRSWEVGGKPQRIALSPDGTLLYIASEAAGFEVLHLDNGVRNIAANVSSGAVGLALSPDGTRVYLTNPPEGRLYIIDPVTRTVLETISGLETPRNVAFTRGGTAALVTGEGGRVYVIR
jgi:YVTN family beta-propeller protein